MPDVTKPMPAAQALAALPAMLASDLPLPRIGRGKVRGYAYFTLPPQRTLDGVIPFEQGSDAGHFLFVQVAGLPRGGSRRRLPRRRAGTSSRR